MKAPENGAFFLAVAFRPALEVGCAPESAPVRYTRDQGGLAPWHARRARGQPTSGNRHPARRRASARRTRCGRQVQLLRRRTRRGSTRSATRRRSASAFRHSRGREGLADRRSQGRQGQEAPCADVEDASAEVDEWLAGARDGSDLEQAKAAVQARRASQLRARALGCACCRRSAIASSRTSTMPTCSS